MAKKIKLHKKEKKKINNIEIYKEDIKKLFNKYIIHLIILIIIISIIPIYFFIIKPNQQKKDLKANKEIYKAEYFFKEENYDKALKGDSTYKGFNEIIEQYPNTKTAQRANFYVGIIHMKRKEYEAAIINLKKFKIDDFLLKARALCLIGDAYSQQGKFREALEYYLKAAKEKPNKIFSPKYLSKAAIVYLKLNDKKGAIDCYKQIIKLYPDSIQAHDAKKKIYALE